MRDRRIGILSAVALLGALLILACGRKGDPYPRKELHRPAEPAQQEPAPKG